MGSKFKVLLVNPANDPEALKSGNYAVFHPIGIIQIATYLRKELGKILDIQICDELLNPDIDKAIRSSDLVGVSMLRANVRQALVILEKAKKTGLITIAGNDHATQHADELLKNTKYIDYILRGDYTEKPFKSLLKKIISSENQPERLADIPSLSFSVRDSIGKVIDVAHNPMKTYPMDDIPAADMTILSPEDRQKYIQLYRSKFAPFHADISTINPVVLNIAQGCERYKTPCLFCGIVDLRLRSKSPEKIFDEIRANYALGYNYFYVIADDFTSFGKSIGGKKSLLQKLYEQWDSELGSIADKIEFFVYAKADNLVDKNGKPNEQILSYIKKFRVTRMNIGIESGSPEILQRGVGKSATIKQNLEAILLCKKEGIQLHISFVLGGIGETTGSLWETFRFIRNILDITSQGGKSNIVVLEVAPLLPVSGSKAWRLMTEPIEAKKAIHSHNINNPKSLELNEDKLENITKKWARSENFDREDLIKDWVEIFTHMELEDVQEYCMLIKTLCDNYGILTGGY